MESEGKPSEEMNSERIDISEDFRNQANPPMLRLVDLNVGTNNTNQRNPAPSEPAPYYQRTERHQQSVHSFDHLSITESMAKNEHCGIGAMNTIDVHLCVEDSRHTLNDDTHPQAPNEQNNDCSPIQRHNKYMFSNKKTKHFYFAPYHKSSSQWNILEFKHIFASNTSFLCDIFSNVIGPLVDSFKKGQSGCLTLYSPDSFVGLYYFLFDPLSIL